MPPGHAVAARRIQAIFAATAANQIQMVRGPVLAAPKIQGISAAIAARKDQNKNRSSFIAASVFVLLNSQIHP